MAQRNGDGRSDLRASWSPPRRSRARRTGRAGDRAPHRRRARPTRRLERPREVGDLGHGTGVAPMRQNSTCFEMNARPPFRQRVATPEPPLVEPPERGVGIEHGVGEAPRRRAVADGDERGNLAVELPQQLVVHASLVLTTSSSASSRPARRSPRPRARPSFRAPCHRREGESARLFRGGARGRPRRSRAGSRARSRARA